MAKKIESTRNTNTESSAVATPLNAVTATTLFTEDPKGLRFSASNPTNKDMVIKAQAASVDNIPVGILLLRGASRHISELDGYTGEVSAMTISGTATIWTTRI